MSGKWREGMLPKERIQEYARTHFCQDEHLPIRHWDSEHERCPLCRARDALNAIDEICFDDAKHSRPTQGAFNKIAEVLARYWDESNPKQFGDNSMEPK